MQLLSGLGDSCSNKMADERKLSNGINKVVTALAALIVYNLILTAFVAYISYYAIHRFESLSDDNKNLKLQVELLQQVRFTVVLLRLYCYGCAVMNL